MTDLYKSRYSQAIPGINRTDDSLQFSHAEKCIPHFSDDDFLEMSNGIPQKITQILSERPQFMLLSQRYRSSLTYSQKLTSDTALAQSQGRDNKIWCESLNRLAESGIRNAFGSRDSKLRQWREHLNKEVDKIAKEIENVTQCQILLVKKRQYFSNMLETSETTSEFRKRMEDLDPNDRISSLLREEQEKITKADSDMRRYLDELRECERQLQKARNSLMSEVEAKSLTINIGKRCQHAEPLLNFPHIPSDHPVDQIYHPNSEEDWERNLIDKVQNSVSVRNEASNSCDMAIASVKQNDGETADAWFRTSKALQEAVQESERTGHNITNLLRRINQDIASASQRIAYFFNDLKVQDRVKHTQLWRLQTMTFRPGHDHIRDAPIRKLDEEVGNIERKSGYVTDNLNHNKDLMQKLNEEKIHQTLELERFSRRLFIERENCLGIRRTVKIQGVNLDGYIHSW